MKKLTPYCILFFVLITGKLFAQNTPVTLNTELKRLYDITQLPKYISGSYEDQKSSYDTTGGNDDGFSGKYSFVRRNPDSTLLIFEAKGKGVINRIWTATPNDDTLDFYFDGKAKPSYSIKFRDLFTGNVFPFVAPLCGKQLGGNFCYLPIPFSNGCKIVTRGKQMQFYQIQCRHYPDGQPVKTFDPDLGADEKASLEKIKTLWGTAGKNAGDFYGGKTKVVNTNALLKPGQTITLLDLKSGGRIVGLKMESANVFANLDKQVDIKIAWDDDKTPAVFAPLSDFFGYSFGSPSMQSLLLGSNGNKNYCYFPMPFDKAAKIELVYRVPDDPAKAEGKTINAKIYYTDEKRSINTEGKFYTSWNSNKNAPKGKPHVFLQTTGKGHYVGTILQAQGLNAGMTTFFEGDDSTATDGKLRLHGTGSEDHFNGGWYALMDRWDTRMSLPLHGALDYSLPLSHTGAYRLYLNDKLSFDKSIFHSIEHGPENNDVPADYTSLGLYYADKAPASATAPTNLLTALHKPDTLVMYPQLMNFSFWGDVSIKSGFDGYIFEAANEARMRIALSEIPYGQYKLYAEVRNDANGADVSIWQRQTMISNWISLAAEKEQLEPKLYLSDITVGDFKNTLTIFFRVNGNKNRLHLNKLIFVKQ